MYPSINVCVPFDSEESMYISPPVVTIARANPIDVAQAAHML